MCVLRCPLCNFIAFSYIALKKHIRAKHSLTDKCPICNKRYKNLVAHFHRQAELSCEKHAVLYALYRQGTDRKRNEVLNRSRELLFEKLCVTK